MDDKSDNNHRRTNKPLMEKRRRARINTCLTELKNLVLMAMNKDNSQFSKLEKADILEMAVKYLRHVQGVSMAAHAIDSTVLTKYRLGYGECAREVISCLEQNPGIGPDLRHRVSDHLSKCLYGVQAAQNVSLALQGAHAYNVFSRPVMPRRDISESRSSSLQNPFTVDRTESFPASRLERNSCDRRSLELATAPSIIDHIKQDPLGVPGDHVIRNDFFRTKSPSATVTNMSSAGARPQSTPIKEEPGNAIGNRHFCQKQRRHKRSRGTEEQAAGTKDLGVVPKQRRLADNYSAAASRADDESVWRPW